MWGLLLFEGRLRLVSACRRSDRAVVHARPDRRAADATRQRRRGAAGVPAAGAISSSWKHVYACLKPCVHKRDHEHTSVSSFCTRATGVLVIAGLKLLDSRGHKVRSGCTLSSAYTFVIPVAGAGRRLGRLVAPGLGEMAQRYRPRQLPARRARDVHGESQVVQTAASQPRNSNRRKYSCGSHGVRSGTGKARIAERLDILSLLR